jgi:ABC-2 type transport system ATP-binding protein
VGAADQISVSGGVLAALVVACIAVLALDVYCIVDIVRRPAVLGGRKWVWILVICLFDLVGPIFYLAFGRSQAPSPEPQAQNMAPRDRAAATADLLYGPQAPPPSPPGPEAQAHAADAPEAPDPPAAPPPPA